MGKFTKIAWIFGEIIMNDKDRLIDSVEERLDAEVRLPHQACSIAYDIFTLMFKHELSDDKNVQKLASKFISLLPEWELEDLIVRQAQYAQRIANYDGVLEYEEMHKLLSLCDEIHSLEYLGLNFNEKLRQEFEESIRTRFEREKRKFKLVAEDKIEDWKQHFWWYKDNLVS
jgi:hypothetical protein